MIRFENITKKYGDTEIIKEINLEIKDSEFVVLIGPSGCGKTTCLKMINRLIEPTSGRIYINDKDISEMDVIELRRNIGYVIQQIGLFPHMTVRQNIELVPLLKKWPREKRAERVKELLDLVGMPPEKFMDRYPTELSGGQKQRIGVARALAADPDIILMDEPFSAIDPIARTQLQDELYELQQKLHKTIVFVTHDIDEALKLADRICIMKEGTVVQFDTPEAILRNPADDFVENLIGKKRIWKQPEYVMAGDIMITNPVKTLPSRTLAQAVEIMSESGVDSILVVDKENRLLGIVTAEDIRAGRDKAKKLEEIYTRNVFTVKPDDSILDVLRLMSQKNIGYVPVVDENNVLKGLITRSTFVNVLGGN
ncbi:betaine/proline/choline family ABC transporter ATP-binding protein [Thermosediminibacter oceani]|uniref:Quaternary amine transport ATP-binding protein n=1 Tax=Thermosediminibacter oceani (strain ATCC BAA-1034 / DSM 16646 / JW/IW-1228P) TaxID=555079 RepID=D9S0P1_THEOJ|nr:betaine/proline/choline family ABC transporter ATP-binding protein [Thermosediminibacter oceani]ADL08899.1 glycine betaine/L-proline ABC transporter, ATPase subunit [Thermosediminibacter oceani DSM 16646]